MSVGLARKAEDACLNGWPAQRQVLLGSAVLRLSAGYTRRANSVNLTGPLDRDPAGFVVDCEAVYRRQGLPVIFRLSTAILTDLAPALDAAGFGPPEDETLVLHRGLADLPAGETAGVELVTDPIGSGWLGALAEIQTLSARERHLHGCILDALAVPAVFALTRCDGRPAALAFGAVSAGMVCLNSVATDAAYRRRGLARKAVAAILAWAARQGEATEACLPVGAGNEAALALYRSLGFTTEALRYHYRRKPR